MITHLLKQKAKIYSVTTSNTNGVVTKNITVKVDNIPCRVVPIGTGRGNQFRENVEFTETIYYTIFFDLGIVLERTDIVEVYTYQYEIDRIKEMQDDQGPHHIEVTAKRVQN
jgi:hypothetical protein